MEKNIASIYKISNNINGKIYIGFDIKYPNRIRQHYSDSKSGKESPLCDEIRTYGWENFTKELLYQSKDIDHCLKVMENYFIIENNSYDMGYNRTLGGNGSLGSPRPKNNNWKKNHSEKMKLSNPRKGYVYTEQEKNKHSIKMREYYEKNPDKRPTKEKNGMYGKKHDDEWKKNHSEKMKSKPHIIESMTVKKPCTKCGFITTLGNLARYHNEKCKRT
jgi:group I intron endonuclease